MKTILTITTFILLSLGSFANTYYIYTAKTSGNWDNSGTWNRVVRNDNVKKNKFIIPSNVIVTADEDVNEMGLNDVELQISGTLRLGSSTTLYFGNGSKIEILATGSIEGNGASQQIFIGNASKYMGNKNKTLSGPLFADAFTGIAPAGFASYSLLAITPHTNVSADKAPVATKIYAANKTVKIEFPSEVKSTVNVKIISMNGVVVASQSFNRPSSTLNINVNQLNTGAYVVHLTDNKNMQTVTKVMVN